MELTHYVHEAAQLSSFITIRTLQALFLLIVLVVPLLLLGWAALNLAEFIISKVERYRRRRGLLNSLNVWYIAVAVVIFALILPFLSPYYLWVWPTEKEVEKLRRGEFSVHFTAIARHALTEVGYEEYRKEEAKDVPPVRTDTRQIISRFTLVSYRPPKHFYVTLKEVGTERLWENLYVSKHCDISDLKPGQDYNISVQYYTLSNRPNEEFMEFTSLYGVFCR